MGLRMRQLLALILCAGDVVRESVRRMVWIGMASLLAVAGPTEPTATSPVPNIHIIGIADPSDESKSALA